MAQTVPADVILVASVDRPFDDVGQGGGAKDLTTRLDIKDINTPTALKIVSTEPEPANPPFTCLVRTVDFALHISDPLTVTNNEQLITFDGDILAAQIVTLVTAEITGSTVGEIQLQRFDGAPIVTWPAGEVFEATMLFVNSEIPGAGFTLRFQKMFWHSRATAIQLGQAGNTIQYRILADPQSNLRWGQAAGVDDVLTIANRLTAPAAIVFVDSSITLSGNVPLLPTQARSKWIEFTATAGDSSFEDGFTTDFSVFTI